MNFSLTLNITCYVLATLCWLPGQFSLHTFKYIIFIKKKQILNMLHISIKYYII